MAVMRVSFHVEPILIGIGYCGLYIEPCRVSSAHESGMPRRERFAAAEIMLRAAAHSDAFLPPQNLNRYRMPSLAMSASVHTIGVFPSGSDGRACFRPGVQKSFSVWLTFSSVVIALSSSSTRSSIGALAFNHGRAARSSGGRTPTLLETAKMAAQAASMIANREVAARTATSAATVKRLAAVAAGEAQGSDNKRARELPSAARAGARGTRTRSPYGRPPAERGWRRPAGGSEGRLAGLLARARRGGRDRLGAGNLRAARHALFKRQG